LGELHRARKDEVGPFVAALSLLGGFGTQENEARKLGEEEGPSMGTGEPTSRARGASTSAMT
jgi:hypothetical protein